MAPGGGSPPPRRAALKRLVAEAIARVRVVVAELRADGAEELDEHLRAGGCSRRSHPMREATMKRLDPIVEGAPLEEEVRAFDRACEARAEVLAMIAAWRVSVGAGPDAAPRRSCARASRWPMKSAPPRVTHGRAMRGFWADRPDDDFNAPGRHNSRHSCWSLTRLLRSSTSAERNHLPTLPSTTHLLDTRCYFPSP